MSKRKRKWTQDRIHTGRKDMQSFDGDSGKAFTNLYADTLKDGFHPRIGTPLPFVVARGEGDDNRANAERIESLWNTFFEVDDPEAFMNKYKEMKYRLESLDK